MASTSMMYTMGMALDRAAESGVGVSILVEGAWVDGHIAAVDGMGVVLESTDGDHTVIRVDRIAAVQGARRVARSGPRSRAGPGLRTARRGRCPVHAAPEPATSS